VRETIPPEIHPQDAILVPALSSREALDANTNPPRGSQIFPTSPNAR